MEPITREEMLMDGQILEPITRKEKILVGEDLEPITREEWFLKKYRGGGGSSVEVEEITITENGTTTAPSGKAYSPVNVNVPNNNNIVQTPRYRLYKEDFIDVISNYDNSIQISWDSGVYVGCSLNGIMDLSSKGFTKLKYDVSFGAKNYDSEVGQNIRPFIIGVTDQIRTGYVYASQSTANQFFKEYDLYDVDYLNQHVVGEVDLSDVEGSFYLLVVATGWNVTINSIELE